MTSRTAMKIYNIRKHFDLGHNVIRVDRGTPWGNPFVMGRDGTRDEVCDKFEAFATKRHAEDPTWLKPLRGKSLACWCAPKRCHAETLMSLANEIGDGIDERK